MEWNFSDGRPIWVQINDELRLRIVTGVYPKGEKLPTVRDLAAEAGVNPNTMQRALAQLETEGLAVVNRTAGRLVTDNEEIISAVRVSLAKGNIRAYLKSMEDLGYSEAEAAELLLKREEE